MHFTLKAAPGKSHTSARRTPHCFQPCYQSSVITGTKEKRPKRDKNLGKKMQLSVPLIQPPLQGKSQDHYEIHSKLCVLCAVFCTIKNRPHLTGCGTNIETLLCMTYPYPNYAFENWENEYRVDSGAVSETGTATPLITRSS